MGTPGAAARSTKVSVQYRQQLHVLVLVDSNSYIPQFFEGTGTWKHNFIISLWNLCSALMDTCFFLFAENKNVPRRLHQEGK